MKKVNTQRFQEKKPENISFQASPLLEKPIAAVKNTRSSEEEIGNERTNESTLERTTDRPNERTVKQINSAIVPAEDDKTISGNFYTIKIPASRVKIRQSFDIFEDQKSALDKIQMALKDSGQKKKPVLGDMAQEAFDFYIKEKSKKLNNIKIIRERPSERTNERSDE